MVFISVVKFILVFVFIVFILVLLLMLVLIFGPGIGLQCRPPHADLVWTRCMMRSGDGAFFWQKYRYLVFILVLVFDISTSIDIVSGVVLY